jgi:hypothetical protein
VTCLQVEAEEEDVLLSMSYLVGGQAVLEVGGQRQNQRPQACRGSLIEARSLMFMRGHRFNSKMAYDYVCISTTSPSASVRVSVSKPP